MEIFFIGRVGYRHASDWKESVCGVANTSLVHRTRTRGCKFACIASICESSESTIISLDGIGTTWIGWCLISRGFR